MKLLVPVPDEYESPSATYSVRAVAVNVLSTPGVAAPAILLADIRKW
jgi:hypothetical protein